MKWFLMLLIFVSGVYYLVVKEQREAKNKEIEMTTKKEKISTVLAADPVLPVKPEKVYVMQFSLQTIKTLRALTQDSNQEVRFASAELLWQLQDESAPAIIKDMFENETELEVKRRLIQMLARDKSKISLTLLAEALKDYEQDIRLLTVEALGTFSNKEAIPVLNIALKDYDEKVRIKALAALNSIRQDIQANKEQQLRALDSKKPLFRIE